MSKFEETIREMEEMIKNIEKTAAEKMDLLDEDGKIKVKEIAERTNNAVKTAIEKVSEVKDSVTNDEELNAFLDKVKGKCKEAYDYTKGKIETTAAFRQVEVNLNKTAEEIGAMFDKVMENDNIENAKKFVKDVGTKINEFIQKPEVQEAVEKLKDTTVAVAEKGIDLVKKAFEFEEAPKETEAPSEEEKSEEE